MSQSNLKSRIFVILEKIILQFFLQIHCMTKTFQTFFLQCNPTQMRVASESNDMSAFIRMSKDSKHNLFSLPDKTKCFSQNLPKLKIILSPSIDLVSPCFFSIYIGLNLCNFSISKSVLFEVFSNTAKNIFLLNHLMVYVEEVMFWLWIKRNKWRVPWIEGKVIIVDEMLLLYQSEVEFNIIWNHNFVPNHSFKFCIYAVV